MRARSIVQRGVLLLSLLVLACASPSSPAATPVPASAATFSIGVQGNHLVDGAGRPVRLLGVNRSGTEYACIQGWGLFDGPSSDASVAAMAAWHINAVRVPLNEDCWLAINGAPAQYSGATYKAAVTAYVHLLNTHGLYAVLDLHLNAPGAAQATGQREMADADHSPAFWADVAKTFSGENAVLFDLYNEPHDISWDCWRDGCSSPGWQTAGSSHW